MCNKRNSLKSRYVDIWNELEFFFLFLFTSRYGYFQCMCEVCHHAENFVLIILNGILVFHAHNPVFWRMNASKKKKWKWLAQFLIPKEFSLSLRPVSHPSLYPLYTVSYCSCCTAVYSSVQANTIRLIA